MLTGHVMLQFGPFMSVKFDMKEISTRYIRHVNDGIIFFRI